MKYAQHIFALITGAGGLLNVLGFDPDLRDTKFVVEPGNFDDDAEALRGDMEKVGIDMGKALADVGRDHVAA